MFNPLKFYNKLVDRLMNAVGTVGANVLDRFIGIREDTETSAEIHAEFMRVNGLSIAEAKAEFFDLLEADRMCEVVDDPVNDPRFEILAPEIRSVLARFRIVRPSLNNLVNRDLFEIGTGELLEGFIVIGEEDDVLICVKPGDEAIYDVQDPAESQEPVFPSIYHLLLFDVLPEEQPK